MERSRQRRKLKTRLGGKQKCYCRGVPKKNQTEKEKEIENEGGEKTERRGENERIRENGKERSGNGANKEAKNVGIPNYTRKKGKWIEQKEEESNTKVNR